jgi:hypothetical protein
MWSAPCKVGVRRHGAPATTRGLCRSRRNVVALTFASFLWSCQREIRLDATSMFALHESTKAMKERLELSKADAVALDGAIDVLTGDATREMLAQAEAAGDLGSPAQLETEARVLAPVHGLTFRQLITAASDLTNSELEGLLAELNEYEAIAAEHQKHLDQIAVVRAGYGMSLATRRSWIDLTVHNGTDRTVTELLFDCRLLENGGSTAREQGTCPATFPAGLAPGTTAIAQSYVGWESEPRHSRKVDARPIRAYGGQRAVLWQVPSELDPRETGAIGDIKTRVAVVDGSLRQLKGVELSLD